MYEYIKKLNQSIDKLIATNKEPLEHTIELFAQSIIEDNMIQVLGTGHSHMIGLEGFIRAGGLGNINAILDSTVLTSDGALRGSELEKLSGLADILWNDQKINEGDLIMVASNSGRNALPIEFAMRAKQEGHTVIAITSVEQSSTSPSRHTSGLKLMDVADIVLDNCVPTGDGLCEVNGRITGAFSSISGMTLMNTICVEAQKRAIELGGQPLVFSSQNVDGFDNDAIYQHFGDRLKCR